MESRFDGGSRALRFRSRSQHPDGKLASSSTTKVIAGKWKRWNKNTGQILTALAADENATQVISPYPGAITERCWDTVNPGPPFRQGGPFALLRILSPNFEVLDNGTWFLGAYQGSATTVQSYTGGFHNPTWIPSLDNALGPALSSFKPGVNSAQLNPTGLDSLANVAYAKLRPKVEIAGLGQAIAESRDLPRMLQTTGKGFASLWRGIAGSRPKERVPAAISGALAAPRGAANQYLNLAFGWAPFVKDVNDVCQVIVNGHDLIERRKAKNDVWQRRTFHEDEVRSETVVYTNSSIIGCQPADNSSFRTNAVVAAQPFTITREVIDRVWYSGLFKYYYPEFDSNHWTAGFPALQRTMQYATLLGAKVDPVLLYKVTPWTWMVDWFTDVGAGLQRLQDLATSSTVSKYFYIMRERTYRYRLRCQFTTSAGQHDLSWYYGGVCKLRAAGSSPFDVNLKLGSLSPFQLSIMGALGLSKWAPW